MTSNIGETRRQARDIANFVLELHSLGAWIWATSTIDFRYLAERVRTDDEFFEFVDGARLFGGCYSPEAWAIGLRVAEAVVLRVSIEGVPDAA